MEEKSVIEYLKEIEENTRPMEVSTSKKKTIEETLGMSFEKYIDGADVYNCQSFSHRIKKPRKTYVSLQIVNILVAVVFVVVCFFVKSPLNFVLIPIALVNVVLHVFLLIMFLTQKTKMKTKRWNSLIRPVFNVYEDRVIVETKKDFGGLLSLVTLIFQGLLIVFPFVFLLTNVFDNNLILFFLMFVPLLIMGSFSMASFYALFPYDYIMIDRKESFLIWVNENKYKKVDK